MEPIKKKHSTETAKGFPATAQGFLTNAGRALRARNRLSTVCRDTSRHASIRFDRPIFIVSAPRAGSTLLFETLCRFPNLWTIGDESHQTIEGIPQLHPAAKEYNSNRLTQEDANQEIASILQQRFACQLMDRDGNQQPPATVRFLEKTPKNALRIPFLQEIFPGALFIFLYREPKENISSIMEGWRSHRFIGYSPLPGWPKEEWSFLLTPGWTGLIGKPLAEIAAYQWKTANQYIMDDLSKSPASSWCRVRYRDLIRQPAAVIKKIAQFAALQWDRHMEEKTNQPLPLSRMVLSPPDPEKWRKNERDIKRILPGVEAVKNLLENNIYKKETCLKVN